MIIFGLSRSGCGLVGCLPLLLGAIVVSLIVLVLSGGHLFVFGI